MDEKIYRLALVRLKKLGRIKREALLNAFGSAERIFNEVSVKDISFVVGLASDEVSDIFLHNKNKALDSAALELEKADKLGAKIFFPEDKGYPSPLLNIRDKPEAIYIKGEYLQSDFYSIGVVGTRKATRYGLEVTRHLVSELAVLGITSVSGLAEGIDSAAHLSSLKAGGRTIAVLGNGLGVCYPVSNRKLMERISSDDKLGVLISEYPPDMQPAPHTFPYRNRIISALSLGVLVVEAGEKSGALITARHALEQGKDVFAVPGEIFSGLSQGCHKLIKMGAKLVTDANDIIEELSPLAEWISRRLVRENPVVAPTKTIMGKSEKSDPFFNNLNLDDKDKKIIDTLVAEGPSVSMDFLGIRTGLPSGELAARLLQLELKGAVRSLPGSYYSLGDRR